MPSQQLQFVVQTLRARPRPERELSFDELRAGMESMATMNRPPAEARMTPTGLAGVQCEWTDVGESRAASGGDEVLLYLHGGGYSMGSIGTHRGLVARIAAACGVRAISVDYRLAPEHPYPAGLEDAVAVYEALLETGIPASRVVLAGDSAGGGLALATLLSLRDSGVPLPAAAVLLSPWVDLSLAGDSIRLRADADPMVAATDLVRMADAYRGPLAAEQPQVSPLFGDLSGLPPLLIQVGTAEVLLDDSTRLAERAQAAGVPVELELGEDLIHVFQFFAPLVPEANEAIERIGQYVRKHL